MSKSKTDRYTVSVDFDGVLHSYTSPWIDHHTIPDPPVEGAIEWLNQIVDRLDVVVFTTRGKTNNGRLAVMTWLRNNGYTGPALTVTWEKLPSLAYLDDRAIRFEGPGTFPSADDIFGARPWNKSN